MVSKEDLKHLSGLTQVIKVASGTCNDTVLNSLNLTFYENLRRVEIGNECFQNTSSLIVTGLKGLQSVVIGAKCFDKNKGSFYLKKCENVRTLRIGCGSLVCFQVCEIQTVPSLETIEMGDVNKRSNNFKDTENLELKSQ